MKEIDNKILVVLLIIFSFFGGTLFMGYLSSKASILFLEMAKVDYINEQEILAIRTEKDENINKAICHFNNIVAAKESLYSFDGTKSRWNLFFPFEAITFKKLSDAPQQGKEIDIGIAHGKLASALDLAGLHKEAEEEYKKASILIHGSPEQVKRLINDLKAHEKEN